MMMPALLVDVEAQQRSGHGDPHVNSIRASRIPSTVNATDPTTWNPIVSALHSHSRRTSSVVTSAENVENVVRPPKNPVVMSSRTSGDSTAWRVISSIATPISRPPTRFAASVPSGTVGKTGFSANESPQRSHAPTAAPRPTAAIELSVGIDARTLCATVPAAEPASTDERVDVRRAEPVVAIVRATQIDLREYVFVARL